MKLKYLIDKNLNNGREIIQELLSCCITKNKKYVIVDLGAGEGKDISSLSKLKNNRIHAIENYPPNITILKEMGVKTHNINIESESLPFEDESVDLLIANQILEHCKEIYWIFSEISRVLKVDGKIIVGVPNLASLHNRILLSIGRQPSCININSAHIRGFSKNGMLSFLDQVFINGYKLLAFKGSNFYPFPPKIAVRISKIFPNASAGIFFLLNKQKRYNNEFINAVTKLATPYFTGT